MSLIKELKKLIQDISIARIKEIFEIMIFKNINLSYYYDNTKTIFIEIENELKEVRFKRFI